MGLIPGFTRPSRGNPATVELGELLVALVDFTHRRTTCDLVGCCRGVIGHDAHRHATDIVQRVAVGTQPRPHPHIRPRTGMDKPRMRQRRHKHIRLHRHPGQRVNNCHGFPGPINAQLLTRGMGQKRSQVVDIDVVFKQRAELPVGIMLLARSSLTAGVFMVFHL